MGMRHGLLRTSCSRNPKNTSNPLIFLRKMAAFRCFARHKVMLACASAASMTFCRLSLKYNTIHTEKVLSAPQKEELAALFCFTELKPPLRINVGPGQMRDFSVMFPS